MKTTTLNVKNFGKHSELLKITDDPLVYVKDEIQKMNEEYRAGRVEYDFKVDFNERVEHTDDAASASKVLMKIYGVAIGFFFQLLHHNGTQTILALTHIVIPCNDVNV